MNSETPELLSIVLTDSPRVVALKREFYDLDFRSEQIKPYLTRDLNARLEMDRLSERKAQIAREIFKPESRS